MAPCGQTAKYAARPQAAADLSSDDDAANGQNDEPEQQPDMNRILTKLHTLKAASWDYAIETAMMVTRDRSKAESYLEQLRNSGQIIQDPDGNWRTMR